MSERQKSMRPLIGHREHIPAVVVRDERGEGHKEEKDWQRDGAPDEPHGVSPKRGRDGDRKLNKDLDDHKDRSWSFREIPVEAHQVGI